MDLLPGPYGFVRLVTVALALFWGFRGVQRAARFELRWEGRVALLGVSRRWVRRQLARALLRATLLDPVNLALALVLVALWSISPGIV